MTSPIPPVTALNHPAQIGFDFDDVIADTASAFLHIAGEKYGLHDIQLDQITDYHVEKCLDMSPEEINTIFSSLLHDPLGAGILPKKGCIPVLEQLSTHGSITIITARPLAAPVEQWLDKYMPDSVKSCARLVAMGDHDEKTGHVTAAGLSHFVDDRGPTCMQLAEAGISSILFEMPWNRSYNQLPTVSDWQEIHRLCFTPI